MKTKHTPGPWAVDTNEERARIFTGRPEDRFGVLVATIAGQAHKESHEANARLIAAAPELLEALKKVVNAWNHDGTMQEAETAVLSALAKAEGNS